MALRIPALLESEIGQSGLRCKAILHATMASSNLSKIARGRQPKKSAPRTSLDRGTVLSRNIPTLRAISGSLPPTLCLCKQGRSSFLGCVPRLRQAFQVSDLRDPAPAARPLSKQGFQNPSDLPQQPVPVPQRNLGFDPIRVREYPCPTMQLARSEQIWKPARKTR